MRHGSLFSGIGGFDLAAEWMGWENVFHCEWNEFGQRILKYYWPKAISYEDITKTDFTIHRGQIDILTGGFPCQPFSTAGKRKGTEDSRYLWPEMLRAIREIKPGWVVGENVRGLVNWSEGLVFEQVCSDLENEGYEVWPVILPACGVDAPHERYRIWFIAHAKDIGLHGTTDAERKRGEHIPHDRSKIRGTSNESCESGVATDTTGNRLERANRVRMGKSKQFAKCSTPHTECKRQQEQGQPKRPLHTKTDSEWKASWAYDDGRWPTQSPICSGDDGISYGLDGITFPKWRSESIKAYGNAIVPQVAYQIFKAIQEYERTIHR